MAKNLAGRMQVVLDTNVFLQLRDVKDLPWAQQFPDASGFDLIVGHTVISELDEKKTSREKRQRDRARLALQLIERASTERDQGIQLRSGPPEIRLELDLSDSEMPSEIRLNPSRNDDQLVALVLRRAKDGRCVLLSHDTGPVIRARAAGVSAVRAPQDWHLPEQPDEQSVELKRLRAEVASLKAARPEIAAAFLDRDGLATQHTISRVPLLPAFPDKLARDLASIVLEAKPPARLPPVRDSNTHSWDNKITWGITGYEKALYEKEYLRFQSRVQELFLDLANVVRQAALAVPVCYRLENMSTETALKLRVRFTGTERSALLVRKSIRREWGIGELGIPEPPEPPKASHIYEPPQFQVPPNYQRPRDPTSFFWQHEPTAEDTEGTFVCEEFRPKALNTFTYYVLPLTDPANGPHVGHVFLEVSATNLSAPVTAKLVIERVQEAASWVDADVLSIFPDELRYHLENWIKLGELTK